MDSCPQDRSMLSAASTDNEHAEVRLHIRTLKTCRHRITAAVLLWGAAMNMNSVWWTIWNPSRRQLSERCSYRLPSAHEDDTGQRRSVRGRLQNSYSPSALRSVTKASTTPTLEMNNDKHTALHMHPQPNIDRQRVVMLSWETGCLVLIMLQQSCRCWTSTAAASCSWCTSA